MLDRLFPFPLHLREILTIFTPGRNPRTFIPLLWKEKFSSLNGSFHHCSDLSLPLFYSLDSAAVCSIRRSSIRIWVITRSWQRGDSDAYDVLYLEKSNIVAYFSIIEEENGTKIIPAEVLRNPGKGRISWIGDFARGGVSFRKAHQMEKDFERVVFKNNDIPFVKMKPLSYSLAHLMMYPLSGMWWHSFLFIFIIVFFWMYFKRSKRWKQEK